MGLLSKKIKRKRSPVDTSK
uniref:Uncharacterized protein n=1 Tax=Anguilla anguilla TaxID=7936 RepID=A0A0E9W0I3_ANGAN